MIIGPSNGWLYLKKVYSMAKQEALFKKAGANAVEISFSSEWRNEENKKRMRSLEENSGFNPQIFVHRSIHLPDITGRENNQEFSTAQKAVSRAKASFALTHPLKSKGDYPIKSYKLMIQRRIPLAIENMDKRKDSGFDLKELGKLIDIVGYFVLDVQHAFERDPTMKYAFDLFKMAKNKLAYLHVSGETSNCNHALVFRSVNCEQIVSFLGTIFSEIETPIILEGEYSTYKELNQEIIFLTQELTNQKTAG